MQSHHSTHKAFTLIELLIVIAIIAILAVVVVLLLNPAELLRQSRDANRMSDLNTLTDALSQYAADQGLNPGFSLGTPGVAYLSIPDPTATSSAGTNCSGLGLSGNYHCPASSTYRNVNGTGWIPVNLTKMSNGSPIGVLPVDPINQSSSNLYYCYVTNGTTFDLVAYPESQKYTAEASTTGGIFTDGSNQTIGGCPNSSVGSYEDTSMTSGTNANTTVSGSGASASVALLSTTGYAFTNYTGGSLSGPYGIAYDGIGDMWVANFFSPSVTKISNLSGTPTLTNYTGGSLSPENS
jgi:prepilin-type N-terminal cleavage/methylation domain-containing protein